MTCYGIDASHYNSLSQDGLNSAKAAGVTWFTHKASESTNMRDDHFSSGVNWAKKAGLYVGAYHVIRSSPSVDSQGNYFLDAIERSYNWRDDPNFIFQVDLEKWPYDSVSGSKGTEMSQWLLDNTGRIAVFLYASKGQYGNGLDSPVGLWNANYPTWSGDSCPSEDFKASYSHSGGDGGPGWAAYSGQTPVFWQYSDNATFGRLYGLDANAFKGTEADFAALIGAAHTDLARKVQDEDMGIIAQGDDGSLYICFGFQSYPIKSERLADIKYVAGQGAYSLATLQGTDWSHEWDSSGWIRKGWRPEVFGPVAGTATLTDAQVQDIAEQVAAALGESTGLSYDQTVAAAKQALLEGAGGAPTGGTHSGGHGGGHGHGHGGHGDHDGDHDGDGDDEDGTEDGGYGRPGHPRDWP